MCVNMLSHKIPSILRRGQVINSPALNPPPCIINLTMRLCVISITLSKNHTTPEPALAIPTGLGPNLSLVAIFCSERKDSEPKLLVWGTCWVPQGSSDSHPSPSGTLTRLTLHLSQPWISLQVWYQIWAWAWWPSVVKGRILNRSYWYEGLVGCPRQL